nr:MAG TPA: protein of unknown function (DUF3844) [Caudoviricetes sp.]
MRTAAKLLWLVVLALPMLVGLSIGFIGLMMGEEETYQ